MEGRRGARGRAGSTSIRERDNTVVNHRTVGTDPALLCRLIGRISAVLQYRGRARVGTKRKDHVLLGKDVGFYRVLHGPLALSCDFIAPRPVLLGSHVFDGP